MLTFNACDISSTTSITRVSEKYNVNESLYHNGNYYFYYDADEQPGIYQMTSAGEKTLLYKCGEYDSVTADDTGVYWLVMDDTTTIVQYNEDSQKITEYDETDANSTYGLHGIYFDGDTRYVWGAEDLFTADEEMKLTKVDLASIGEVQSVQDISTDYEYQWVSDEKYVYVRVDKNDKQDGHILYYLFRKDTGEEISPETEYIGFRDDYFLSAGMAIESFQQEEGDTEKVSSETTYLFDLPVTSIPMKNYNEYCQGNYYIGYWTTYGTLLSKEDADIDNCDHYICIYNLDTEEKKQVTLSKKNYLIYAEENRCLVYNKSEKDFSWYDYETEELQHVQDADYIKGNNEFYFDVCDGNVLVFDDEMNLLDWFEI
jgi:hypothetical protein